MSQLKLFLLRLAYKFAYWGLLTWWRLVHPKTQGACVALWHQGKVLMVISSYRNVLSFPGGFADPKKPQHEEALRELAEELGINGKPYKLKLGWEGGFEFERRWDYLSIWEAEVSHKPQIKMSLAEIRWAGWITPTDALKRTLPPHYRAYLQTKVGN